MLNEVTLALHASLRIQTEFDWKTVLVNTSSVHLNLVDVIAMRDLESI